MYQSLKEQKALAKRQRHRSLRQIRLQRIIMKKRQKLRNLKQAEKTRSLMKAKPGIVLRAAES